MTRGEKLQAYRLLFFLTLLNLLNFIDRQLIASFANFIVPDLGLTDTQYGFLTSLAFILFYSIMGLFMGALADMVNRPRLIAFGVVLWSIFTAVSGMAKGFVSMMIPRMFIGVGESILTPTSMSLLSDSFPSSRLGFASGFYYMGVPVGVGISLLIVGYLGEPLGWRNCFYILGAIGFVMGLMMLLFKDRPRKSSSLDTSTTNETLAFSSILKTLKKALMNSPALVLTIAGGVFYHIVLGAAVFEQLWYAQEKNFDRSSIAQITGIISVVAGISGNLLGGILSDLWQSKTNQGRPMFLFWACLIMLPIFIVFRYSEPNSILFWVGVTLGYFQLGLFYGPVFSTVQELVPIKIRATIVAFLILMLNLVGLTFGSLGGGVAVDLLRAASVENPYTTMLVIFTAISALNIPCYYFAGKLYDKDKRKLEEVFAK